MLALADTVALVALVLLAAWSDMRTRRIPNALTVSGLAVALALQAAAGLDAFIGALAGAGLMLLIAVPVLRLDLLGGGDVKLLIAIGAFTGPAGLLQTLLATGVAGGVLALAVAARGRVLPLLLYRSARIAAGMVSGGRPAAAGGAAATTGITVPYGTAIAIGTLAARFLGGG